MNATILKTAFFVIAFSISRNASADTSVTVGSAPGYPGTATTVPVLLRNSTNVVAAQFDVAFNGSKVSSDAVTKGVAAANHIVRSREIAPGVRRVVAYSLSGASLSNNAVAMMPFRLAATEHVGSGPLVPSHAILGNPSGDRISPVTLNSGQIFARPVNRRDDGIVDFFLPSRADEKYLIQATTNFVQWANISTNVAITDFMQLVDMDGPIYPYRYYRSAVFDAIARGLLNDVVREPNGVVTFQVSGLEGRRYTIQASMDLVNWTDLDRVTVLSGKLMFADRSAPDHRVRFYRLKSDP
jgi:Cohesin domain